MSYCRWSSERFQCDLYCYEDVHGGWTTHVAGRRREPVPDHILDPMDWRWFKDGPEAWTDERKAEWKKARDAFYAALEQSESITIDSPHAGKSYNDPTLEDFRARVVELSADPALNVPDWLLPSIDEEIDEISRGPVDS